MPGEKRAAEDNMSTVKVTVKWGKETYSDVEARLDESPLVFKSQLFALTGVPPDRQKVMIKGALLKDDDWGKAVPKEGATVSLLGSAEPHALVEPPKNLPKFVEDLPESQQVHMEFKGYGAGLQNLGNTCYANSVLQVLYAVQPLREALVDYKPATTSDTTSKLVLSAKQLVKDMEGGGEPFPPFAFLMCLREKFPQFAQTGQGGIHAQQDAEECMTSVMQALRERLKNGDGSSKIEELFGIKTTLKLKCEESGEELQEQATSLMLKCNIDSTVNHLHDGILLGLKDDREKTSEKLGRMALFKGMSAITRLPPFLNVQLVRFFYKTDTQSKAKVLRKVSFQPELDVYEFCSPELKEALAGPRAAYKEAVDRAIEERKAAKNAASRAAMGGSAAAASAMDVDATKTKDQGAPAAAPAAQDGDKPAAPVAEAPAAPMEVDSSSAGAGAASSSSGGQGPGPHNGWVGADTGKYELCGVLTHKGRSADSGHYTSWIKQSDGKWILFDDDKLSIKTEEDILALSGGGDWHMAYVLLYKAIRVPAAGTAAAADAAARAAAASGGK